MPNSVSLLKKEKGQRSHFDENVVRESHLNNPTDGRYHNIFDVGCNLLCQTFMGTDHGEKVGR